MTRRQFAHSLAASTLALAATPVASLSQTPGTAPAKPVRLGIDNFAVRAMGWKGRQLIDYADSLKLDTLFITDLPSLGTDSEAGCRELRSYAADRGIELLLGSWSICPTSKTFKKDWGTAEEHLAHGLRLSKALGSPAFRVVLGAREDRRTPGGIRARIADTVRVLQSQRSLALDLGVKVAMENHAGDMRALELVDLVEEAGRDYVGVNLDSGNATWTLEDPMQSLEILGPYTLTTSLRDTAIWETEKGCRIQWTAYPDGGCVDPKAYFKRFAELCPGVAVNIETIGGFSIEFPYLDPEFWTAFPEKPASELASFIALAKKGKPVESYNANDPDLQRRDIEKSFRYLKSEVGLGTRR